MRVQKMYFFGILIILLGTAGCDLFSGGSKIKGQIVDVVTGQPVSDATITAITKTNIEEDKKFERRQSSSDKNGQFTISGLSHKYTYTITASKNGFSTAKTRQTPPEKGQTKLIEEPLSIAMLPPEYGVYIFSKSTFDKLNSISFATIKRDSRIVGGRDHYDYISKDDLSEALKTCGRDSILISYSSSNIRWNGIDPLRFFKEKKFSFTYDNPRRTDNIKSSIYVAKAVRDDLAVLNTYELSRYSKQYVSPKGMTVGGVGTLEGELPSSRHECPNGIIEVTRLNYLPSGLYALRDGKTGRPFRLD